MRVTVAVALLAVATVAVLLSLPTQSPALLSVSAVTALVLGWAALRIVWTEVLQSRREHAGDRAATATAYKSLFSERAAEHAEFTSAMTERLAESNQSMHELQAALVQAQRQAAASVVRADSAESAHASALIRVAELERSIELLRTQQIAADLVDGPAAGSVEDLMSFDEQLTSRLASSHLSAGAEAAGKHAKDSAKLA